MAENIDIHVRAHGETQAISDAEKKLKSLKSEQAQVVAGQDTVRLQETGLQHDAQSLSLARQKIAAQTELNEEIAAGEALKKGGPAAGGGSSSGGGMPGFGGISGGSVDFAIKIGEQVRDTIDGMSDHLDETSMHSRQMIRESIRDDRHYRREAAGATGAAERTSIIDSRTDELDNLQTTIEQQNSQLAGLERKKGERILDWGLKGAAMGSVIPGVGTLLGAGIGAVGAMAYNKLYADEEIGQVSKQQELTEQQRDKVKKQIDGQRRLRAEDMRDETALSNAKAHHNMAEAHSLEDKILREQKYHEALQAFGLDEKGHQIGEKEAGQIADNAVNLKHQQEAQEIAGHLVTARSGAGDIARAATLADQNSSLRHAIDSLHNTVKHHAEASTRKNFAES